MSCCCAHLPCNLQGAPFWIVQNLLLGRLIVLQGSPRHIPSNAKWRDSESHQGFKKKWQQQITHKKDHTIAIHCWANTLVERHWTSNCNPSESTCSSRTTDLSGSNTATHAAPRVGRQGQARESEGFVPERTLGRKPILIRHGVTPVLRRWVFTVEGISGVQSCIISLVVLPFPSVILGT